MARIVLARPPQGPSVVIISIINSIIMRRRTFFPKVDPSRRTPSSSRLGGRHPFKTTARCHHVHHIGIPQSQRRCHPLQHCHDTHHDVDSLITMITASATFITSPPSPHSHLDDSTLHHRCHITRITIHHHHHTLTLTSVVRTTRFSSASGSRIPSPAPPPSPAAPSRCIELVSDTRAPPRRSALRNQDGSRAVGISTIRRCIQDLDRPSSHELGPSIPRYLLYMSVQG